METVGLINTENNMPESFIPDLTGMSAYANLISNIDIEEKVSTLLNSIDYMDDNRYYDIERFRGCLERIKETKNYNFIINYIYFYRTVKNWKIATCIRAICVYLKYHKFIDFNNLTIHSTFSLFMNVKQSKYAQASKSLDWRKLRQMIKFAGFPYDTSEFYMPEPKGTIRPENLLTKDEFELIISELEKHQYGKGLEYKAFLYIIADTGCRTSEVLSINTNRLIINKEGFFEIVVSGKTGERNIVLYHSTEVLQQLINSGWNKWSFQYCAFYRQLKRVVKRTGINKRVYNHLLRHAFGSFIAEDNSVSIEVKNNYCGWSPRSRALETTYAHFSQRKVIDLMKPVLEKNPLFACA